MTIDADVIERLEAEAKVSDARPEELTVAVESEVEETQEQVEELSATVAAKESEVEELQASIEEKESEVEELQEEIETVADFYAEELADYSPVMDEAEWKDRYSVSELREKFEDLDTDSKPAPNSADSGPAVQSPEDGDGDEPGEETVEEELSDMEQVAADSFRKRAQMTGKSYWADIADDIESSDGDN